MESQLTTIVCPNCGANTTNHHNCDYCGSFLVQKAAQGIDMTGYKECAQQYYLEGLEKVLKKYLSILKTHYRDAIEICMNVRSSDNSPIVHFDGTESFGIRILIFGGALEEIGLINRFKNSNVFKAFQVTKGKKQYSDGSEEEAEFYEIDFGDDYSGAALVANQLISDVYRIKTDDMILSIDGPGDGFDENGEPTFSSEAIYNIKGEFLYGMGDGTNQFESVETIKNNFAALENAVKNEKPNLWGMNKQSWILTAAIVIIGILMYLFTYVL